MYTATVTVDHDSGALEQLFLVEEKSFGRSSYTTKIDEGQFVCTISADDATAFKIAMSTISKIFTVWEKSKLLSEE